MCRHAYHVEWRKKNPQRLAKHRQTQRKQNAEGLAAARRRYLASPKGWAFRTWVGLRSPQRGKIVTVTKEDVFALYQPDPICPCCQAVMTYKGQIRNQPNAVTVDKILPERGYVVGNIQLLCRACNVAKGGMTLLQARIFLKMMELAAAEQGNHDF